MEGAHLVRTQAAKIVTTIGAFSELKIYENAFAAGAPPRTPLGELTALPRPPSWFWGRGRKGVHGREMVN